MIWFVLAWQILLGAFIVRDIRRPGLAGPFNETAILDGCHWRVWRGEIAPYTGRFGYMVWPDVLCYQRGVLEPVK